MIKNMPVTTPVQTAATPKEASADMSANSWRLRINIYRLRKTALPRAPMLSGLYR
jgi:hypothetical protein